jgi:hypothetical protein
MKITLCTIAYGDYWEKYSERYLESLKKLNRKPDQLLIVSDKPLETIPSDVGG